MRIQRWLKSRFLILVNYMIFNIRDGSSRNQIASLASARLNARNIDL